MSRHRDPFHRVAVVLRGDLLSIEDRDGGESQSVEVTPGQVEWEEPSARVHRAVNVGRQPYEQVTVFLLDRPDAVVNTLRYSVASWSLRKGVCCRRAISRFASRPPEFALRILW